MPEQYKIVTFSRVVWGYRVYHENHDLLDEGEGWDTQDDAQRAAEVVIDAQDS